MDPVREQLRRASEELGSAREATTAADDEEYLAGIVRLLDYYVEGDVTDPEARAYPPPGALDTIQSRVTEAIEGTDGPAAENLQDARSHLLQAILTLDDRLKEGKRP